MSRGNGLVTVRVGRVKMTETVLYEIEDRVALLTLNRPDRMNAMTVEMQDRLFDLLEEAGRDPEVRAIVLTGAGRAFCAGRDMSVLEDVSAGTREVDANLPSRPWTLPISIPKPTIAAINGACAGVGFVAAAAYDLRFAAVGAKLTTSFARRGLIAEHGISWILPRMLGSSGAMDLLLSGRVVLAEEAQRIGFVDRVVNPEDVVEEALSYARDLAALCSPRAMATIKHQVYSDLTTDLASSAARARELVRSSVSWPDIKEGISSFVERRDPDFPPLTPDTVPG